MLSVGTSPVSLFVLSSTVDFAIPLSATSPPEVRLARLSAVGDDTLSIFFATCASVAMVVGLFPALVLLDGTVGLIWKVLSPVIVSVHAKCTTLSSSDF